MRLRENDESPRPQKRRRAVEPTESVEVEPTEPDLAEQAALAAEATVAQRRAAE